MSAEHLPDVGYLHHGMDDAGQIVPDEWFDAAIDWIDEAGPGAVVLTHCHMGINRGPSLGFAVLLHQGWDPIDAIDAIRAARPIAHVWYAGDALRWHHTRQGTDPSDSLERLETWRKSSPLPRPHHPPADAVRRLPRLGLQPHRYLPRVQALVAADAGARMTNPAAFTVADAERIATKLHAGQVDKAGQPYVGHLARTAAGAAAVAPADLRDHATMAGWLHDSIEDTGTTVEELRDLGVPTDVVNAVVLLTKSAGVDTREYLTRIAGDPLALLVKTADMNDNADERRLSVLPNPAAARLRERYLGYRTILTELTGAPGH